MDDFNSMLESIGISTERSWNGFHSSQATVEESRGSVEEEVVNTEESSQPASITAEEFAAVGEEATTAIMDKLYGESTSAQTEDIRDLDAEEDADWDAALHSGYISPVDHVEVEEDSDGHQFSVHHNVQAEESSPDNEVHFHMPDGVIDVPVVREAESTEESTDEGEESITPTSASLSDDDFSDILADNGFNSEVSEAYDELMGTIDEAEADSLEDDTQEETQDSSEDTVSQESEMEAMTRPRPRRRFCRNQEVEETAREEIPLNSPTLLIDNTTSRFSGAEWYETIKLTKIILAGLGGIGRIQK